MNFVTGFMRVVAKRIPQRHYSVFPAVLAALLVAFVTMSVLLVVCYAALGVALFVGVMIGFVLTTLTNVSMYYFFIIKCRNVIDNECRKEACKSKNQSCDSQDGRKTAIRGPETAVPRRW